MQMRVCAASCMYAALMSAPHGAHIRPTQSAQLGSEIRPARREHPSKDAPLWFLAPQLLAAPPGCCFGQPPARDERPIRSPHLP